MHYKKKMAEEKLKTWEDGVYCRIQRGLNIACEFAREHGFKMEFPNVEDVRKRVEEDLE